MFTLFAPAKAIGIVAVVGGLSLSPQACAVEIDAQSRVMTISANGTATARPDLATINVGVITEAETAEAALSNNSQKMSALLDALGQAGLEEKDVQTSSFNVSPRYSRVKSGSLEERSSIIGYQVSNLVHVKVRDVDRLGHILDLVSRNGANQMHGIQFGFADPQPLLDEARVNATREALRRANLYADAAELKLGDILTFQEQGGHYPVQARAMAESYSDAPIAVGESQISASVTLTIELK